MKVYRKKYNLTQIELGKVVGVSKDYISQIERGRIPGIETARKIAETFNTTIDDIFFSK